MRMIRVSLGALATGLAMGAIAVPAVAAQEAATVAVNVPAQPLAQALLRLADQAGVQLVVPQALVRDLRGNAVNGRYSVRGAFTQMLAGTGLRARFLDARRVQIEVEPSAAADGTRMLGTVRVEGVTSDYAGGDAGSGIGVVSGVNGSRDPTATEGSQSYTAGATTAATKVPRSIRETPQTVSVLTRQRLDDQRLTTVEEALRQAPGITVQQNIDDQFHPRIFSRGYEVKSVKIDGGAPRDYGDIFDPLAGDTFQYDHIEVLRGSDATFGGFGQPGGTINLTRKRGLDHFQLTGSLQFGSWNHYRQDLDVTGPLNKAGTIRARLVAAATQTEFFYDVADQTRVDVMGTMDVDVSPTTTLVFGTTYLKSGGTFGFAQLPLYSDGRRLPVPRDTCFCTNWSRDDRSSIGAFVRAEQKLFGDWKLNFIGDYTRAKVSAYYSSLFGAYFETTGQGPTFSARRDEYKARSYTLDLNAGGSFILLGNKQTLVVGASYTHAADRNRPGYDNLPLGPIDVLNFDPQAIERPTIPNPLRSFINFRDRDNKNLYASSRFTPWRPLHFDLGVRASSYTTEQSVIQFIGNPAPVDPFSGRWEVTPSFSAQLDVLKHFTVYGSSAEIFEPQDTLARADGTPLPPITGRTIEGGVKGSWHEGQLNLSVAFYSARRNNQAVFDFSSFSSPNFGSTIDGRSCCYAPRVSVLSRGIDAEISGSIIRSMPELQLMIGLNYNTNKYDRSQDGSDSSDLVPGRVNTITPPLILRSFASYRTGRLALGGGVNFQTRSFSRGQILPPGRGPNEFEFYEPFENTQKPYSVVNLFGSYEAFKGLTVSLNVDNVFDTKYYSSIGTPDYGNFYGRPRRLLLSLAAKI